MENSPFESRTQQNPVCICLYTCIPEDDQFKRQHYALTEWSKSAVRNYFNRLRTSLTGRLHFDTYSYMIANGLGDNSNRGDMAIRLAIRSLLRSAFAPRPVDFFEIGWGQLSGQNIDDINRRANLFVIAGGGYIFLNGDGTPGAMLANSGSLTNIRCPVVALGIGLNRLMHETTCQISELPQETQGKVDTLSHACKWIGVRDQDTAELFEHYGDKRATVIGDPVLYFSEESGPVVARSGRLNIGVNLAAHGWRAYSILEPMLPHIISSLMRLQEDREADIAYFMHHDFERPVVAYLQKKGLRLRVVGGTAAELIGAYKEVDFVINQMLHSCIFAANAGVPFLNLAYDRKSLALCSLLGIPECAVEHVQVTPEFLSRKLNHLLEAKSELSKRIVEKKAWLRAECRGLLRGVVESVAE